MSRRLRRLRDLGLALQALAAQVLDACLPDMARGSSARIDFDDPNAEAKATEWGERVYGHTGVVDRVNADGTMETIETAGPFRRPGGAFRNTRKL